MKKITYVLIFLMLCGGTVHAEEVTSISTHEGWKVYSFLDAGEKICFMSAQPQKQEGKFKKRGEVFFFVTRWPGEENKNVVSVSGGYAFKPGSSVSASIDGKKFVLFTEDEMAWTKDRAMDSTVVEALQKGTTLVVKGTSRRDTQTIDTYSLKGVPDAYLAMTKECVRETH